MSTTVIASGFIGALLNPIANDEHEELADKLRLNTNLEINHEGLLLYSDDNQSKRYSEREFCGDLLIVGKLDDEGHFRFIEASLAAGVPVDPETVKPYTCIYYNGGDSPLDMMDKEDFIAGNV